VLDLAQDWLKDNDSEKIPDDAALGQWAAGRIRQGQEASLRSFRVEFNNWQRESDLYAEGRAQRVIDVLSQRGLTYQKDGALFFKASQFGDDEDRVLRKSDGDFTYVVPDIAYHLYKRERGFDTAVDLLGPDHHGYIQRMEAALKGLGVPDGFLKALLIQQVNLKRDGQEVKMSKRAGVGVTLDELVEEVGVDAARYFFLLRRITSPLDFDIDLAMRHSDENPVYYVQYAHARICSILRQPQALESTLAADLSLLTEPEELGALRAMARFPWTLSAIVRGVDPHPLTAYLTDLAKSFHQFYTRHRVITDDAGLTAARLALCRGVAAMLKDGLNLMGVSAPEKM